jgi:hypothetical protein
MSNHRPVTEQAQQFIKAHPLTAASRYNNGGNHGVVGISVSVSVSVS